MELVLGIDLGTSYFKLGLFDRQGTMQGLGRAPVEAPAGEGWRCELPVERFWSALRAGMEEALGQAGAKARDVRALSYSSQANTFLLLDQAARPLTPLVIWSDLRASPVDPPTTALWARSDFIQATGVGVAGPQFALAKLRWFQTHQPSIWAKTRRVLTISDYFVASLTGQAVGDEGTASLLGLWDLEHHAFWPPALEAAGLSAELLSRPLPPGTLAGPLAPDGAARLGLKAGVPLAVGSLDHHVAAIGAGVGQTADFSESTGTVLACLRYSDEYRPLANCIMGPASHGRKYYQLAFDGNGAAGLEWYQKNHAPSFSIAELVEQAAGVPAGCDGLLARPQANRRPGLEGFINRSPAHGHGHYARAIMESTAATLVALLETLSPGRSPTRLAATGGGARSELWLKIKADLTGAEFVTTDCHEPACKGAAMIASVATGWFDDLAQAGCNWVRAARTVSPDPAGMRFYSRWLAASRRAIDR